MISKKTPIEHIANRLLKLLNREGLGAYIWHKATTKSCYIRFEDSRLGSIRIADHNGREKYQYKFNVRTDISRSYIDREKWRFYYIPEDIDKCVERIKLRKEQTKNWEKKYEYGIPSWKRNKDE